MYSRKYRENSGGEQVAIEFKIKSDGAERLN